jgi:hypothetical protein
MPVARRSSLSAKTTVAGRVRQPYGVTRVPSVLLRNALALRPSDEIVVAGPVRERRGVTIVNGVQPKPIAPNCNHHAFIVIIVTLDSVALSEGPEVSAS